MTYGIMTALCLMLAFLLLYKSRLTEDTSHFFDLQNTAAMRGFWCIIVILVHIPAAYQNRLQDALGSFAYIGVTSFFMTSAYGLKAGAAKNPEAIKVFWRRRLPKLLVPMLLVNGITMLMHLAEGTAVSAADLIFINMWIVWLLACYLVYWTVNRFGASRRERDRDLMVCLLVAVGSAVVYCLKNRIGVTTWCPEVFGFIWGVILADCKDWFSKLVKKNWLPVCIILCLLSGILGVMYLKFKPVPVFGDYLLKIMLGLAIISFMLALNVRIALGNKLSLFLGKISYEVYLLHGAVFGLLAAFAPGLDSGVFIVLSIAVTIVLSWLVSIVSKPIVGGLNKWLS